MEGRLQGKVAIVTGAGRGIGQAIAKRFADEGAKVVLCDLLKEGLEETAALCPSGSTVQLPCDVRKIEDAQAMADAALKFGGKIDILVNDAGITRSGGVANAVVEEWLDVINTNLIGPYYIMRAVLPHMMEAGVGSIVSISSLAGIRRMPEASAYSTSKSGLIGLAQSVAFDYGKHGIRSNVICPGLTHTHGVDQMAEGIAKARGTTKEIVLEDMVRYSPARKLAPPAEIAAAAVYFASDESTSVTGTVLSVDAGAAIVDASVAGFDPHERLR